MPVKSCNIIFWPKQRTNPFIAGFFILMTCLLANIDAIGQSFYYFEYKIKQPFQDTQAYFALLTIFPDGSAEARIRFEDIGTHEDCLFQLNLIDSTYSGSQRLGSARKQLIPIDKLIVSGNTHSFSTPLFEFQKNSDQEMSFYEPTGIRYLSGDVWKSAEIVDQRFFSFPELSQTFVSVFYNQEEPFFLDLFKLDTRNLNNRDRKTKMFLLLVANTEDESIGTSSRKDLDHIKGTFIRLAVQMGIRFELTTISGTAYSKKAVEDAIAALQPSSRDIVVFYYSGHGYRLPTETSKFPNMVLSNNYTLSSLRAQSLNMEDMYERIVKKGARLNLVFSDCCNEKVDAPAPTGRELLTTRSAGLPISIENCQKLFFSPKPTSILVTSADVDQLASGNPSIGGFFSWHFKASLDTHTSRLKRDVSWVQILNEARVNTAKQARTALCGPDRVRCQQYPWFSIKL